MGVRASIIRASFPGTNQTRTIYPVDSHLRDPRMAQMVIADDILVTLKNEYTVGLNEQGRAHLVD